MASKSEVGYNINIANLQQLIQFAQNLGPAYNPSKPYLSIASLQDLHTQATNALQEVQTKKSLLINAVNDRASAYGPIKKIATRVINALDASDVDNSIVKDARTIVNKMSTYVTKKDITPNEDGEISPKSISTSRQSYDSLLENFSMLTTLVTNVPNYDPNETALKVTNLQSYLQGLTAANNAVNDALFQLANARYFRNASQFMPLAGVVDVSQDFKKYIKSVFGGDSHQYKTISNISFKRYKFTPSAHVDPPVNT